MSTPSDEIAELIDLFQSNMVSSACGFAIAAFLVYEYVITIGAEIGLFWRRKITSASVLFFVNRYLVLALNIYILSDGGTRSDKACEATVFAVTALGISQYIPWAVFSGLRAFALTGRAILPAAVVLALSLVPVGLNLSQFHWLAYVNDWTGCYSITPVTLGMERTFTILSRVSLITADIIVIAITWRATYGSGKFPTSQWGARRSFAHTLKRDGTTYFVILMVLNSLHLTFTLSAIAQNTIGGITSYMSVFTEPITSVLVSRFLLNLQEVNQDVCDFNDSRLPTLASQQATMMFARVIGPLGSSVARDSMSLSEFEMTVEEPLKEDECGEARANMLLAEDLTLPALAARGEVQV